MGIKGYNHPGRKHPVVAVNPDGSVHATFEFIKDAASHFNCDRHSITDSCRRGSVCNGYRWFYEEEFRKLYMNCELERIRWTPDPNRNRWNGRLITGHQAGNGSWNDERRKLYSETMRRTNRKRKEAGDYAASSAKLCKPCFCLDDGREFPSVGHAARFYGIPRNSISGAIHRVGKVRGLRIRLKSQYEN